MAEVVTIPLAEAGETEEEGNKAISDAAFIPSGPLTSKPSAYVHATTYALAALVEDPGHGYYRSLEAGNKEHHPHESPTHWAPVSISVVPLTNPAWAVGATTFVK